MGERNLQQSVCVCVLVAADDAWQYTHPCTHTDLLQGRPDHRLPCLGLRRHLLEHCCQFEDMLSACCLSPLAGVHVLTSFSSCAGVC